MQLSKWIIPIGALLLAAPSAAQNFFPLAEGNYWVYQNVTGSDTVTVSVRGTESAGGRIYFVLHNYAEAPMLVRTNEAGDLVAFDKREAREQLLTRFRNQPVPYITSIGGCMQTANAQSRRIPYNGLTDSPAGALEILYQPLHCRDVGIEQELYVENIGLVRRTDNSILGPFTYNLVAARVGRLSFSAQPGGEARLTLDQSRVRRSNASGDTTLIAALRVVNNGPRPIPLQFPSSQRMDLTIRNKDREIVYSWSADKTFLLLLQEIPLDKELSFSVQAPIPVSLPDGEYFVEAWLTTSGGARFSASTSILLDGITLYFPD